MTAFDIEQEKPPPIFNRIEQARVDAVAARVAGLDMKIVWDESANTIKIGEATFDKYTNWKDAQAFGKWLMCAHGITEYSHHPKWFNKAASALVKGSLKQTYGFFKALQYKAFVAPYIHLIGKISFIPGRINVGALKHIAANKDILQQVYVDRLFHLLPIVAMMGKSPQELKKELGPTWKVLSKNTLNKNKAVAKAAVGVDWGKSAGVRGVGLVNRLKDVATLPTTVLNQFHLYDADLMSHFAQHYRGKWNAKYVKGVSPEWQTVAYEYADTREMARQLDEKFDPLWTPRKMKEKHDEFSRRINALRYSPEPILWLENILPRFEHEGCVATLLNNRAAIAQEGNEMGHCVGIYAESVASKSYLVYSVLSPSGERSTLGIRVKAGWQENKLDPYFILNQHYRRFNRPLEEDVEKEIGQLIVYKLNKGEIV